MVICNLNISETTVNQNQISYVAFHCLRMSIFFEHWSVPVHFFFQSDFKIIARSKLGFNFTIRKHNHSSK